MGGDEGGGDGEDAGLTFQKDENAKKDALRARINQIYGVDSGLGAPSRETFTRRGPALAAVGVPGELDSSPEMPGAESVDEAGYAQALAEYTAAGGDPVASAARKKMAEEESSLTGATRSYYGDGLNRSYEKAARKNRFNLADSGNLGGSLQADTEGELKFDQGKGSMRVTDEVQRALNLLRNSREGERLQAVQLVNSGAGDDAVSAAGAGLSRAYDNARVSQKADLTSDLFSGVANAAGANNLNQQNAALAALYQRKLGNFFPSSGGTGSANVRPT